MCILLKKQSYCPVPDNLAAFFYRAQKFTLFLRLVKTLFAENLLRSENMNSLKRGNINAIGPNIRRFRKAKGLSPEELSE